MYDLCWITLHRDEQRERDWLDQRIDCLSGEAFRAFECDMMGHFNALVVEIATLQDEIANPFDLEIIW